MGIRPPCMTKSEPQILVTARKVSGVMVTVGSAFDDFDLVVDSFQFTGMNGVVTVIEDSVPIPFKGFGKLGDRWVSYCSGQGTPLIDSLVGPGSRCVGPDMFEFVLENMNEIDGFIQFQELRQVLSVFESSDFRPVTQQQVLGSFDDRFMGFAGFSVFAIADFVDDAVEFGDNMKQVEDNGHVRNFLPDGSDIGVPHIHGDGFQGLSLFFRHAVKESFQSSGFAFFTYPDHSSCLIIENHGQIAMSLADGNFVYSQNTKLFVIGLAIVLFQKPSVDGFDGFPIQSQMLGNFFDRHHLTQLVDIKGQPLGYPEIWVEQIQVLDDDFPTLRTNDFAIVTADPNPGRGKVEIPDPSLVLTVHANPLAATAMTNRMKPLVWNNLDEGLLCFQANPLLDDTNPRKGKIRRDTHCGHSGPPLDKCVSHQYNSYPLEVPDVLLCCCT